MCDAGIIAYLCSVRPSKLNYLVYFAVSDEVSIVGHHARVVCVSTEAVRIFGTESARLDGLDQRGAGVQTVLDRPRGKTRSR